MPPLHKVSFTLNSSVPLNSQTPDSIYPYGFPFTLNPTMGCSFVCKFCYSPIFLKKNIANKRNHFFNESTVKLDIATIVDKDLNRLSSLPQHLKRVQINETSDYYLPEVINALKKQNRDVMLEILKTFKKHWDNGNKWMLHILTKSHLILMHLNQLKLMKDMIQIEMSFSTPYETQLRDLELYTPTIKKRLDTIEKLAKQDIFVRIMAMPFNGGAKELDDLKTDTFGAGAQAMKNKKLNYFTWPDVANINFNDLIQYKLPRTGSRKDSIISRHHIIKSGEDYLVNGSTQSTNVLMPDIKAWDAMSKFNIRSSIKSLNIVDMGYSQLNSVNWGYMK